MKKICILALAAFIFSSCNPNNTANEKGSNDVGIKGSQTESGDSIYQQNSQGSPAGSHPDTLHTSTSTTGGQH